MAFWKCVTHLGGWAVPLLYCYYAWPVLERRRWRVVAAAILCLTPQFAVMPFTMTLAVWPLVLCLPFFLSTGIKFGSPAGLFILYYMTIPAAITIGPLAWWLAGRLVPRKRRVAI